MIIVEGVAEVKMVVRKRITAHPWAPFHGAKEHGKSFCSLQR